MKLIIDTDKITAIAGEAPQILLHPDGEQALIDLYKISDMVEQAIHEAKERIKEAAIQIDPNFMSVQGNKVKVSYRAYGSRFSIDQSMVEQMDSSLYKTTVKYSPEPKAIEAFIEEHKGLPVGVNENAREKQIQITIKEDK